MKDGRKALPEGTVLNFPGFSCEIGEEAGRGSLVLVYNGIYHDALDPALVHHVLLKELFPLQTHGLVFRQEDGCVCVQPKAEKFFEACKRRFEAGNQANLALLASFPDQAAVNLNTYEWNGTLYTLLGVSGGLPLSNTAKEPARSLRVCASRMLAVLEALEVFHKSGLLHLAVAPENILLLGSGSRERAMLVNDSCFRETDLAGISDTAVSNVLRGYTAPEVRAGRVKEIGSASDLYSAAAVFYKMMTGTELTDFQTIRPGPPDVSDVYCVKNEPETVKVWVREILRRGLAAVPSRRYQNTEEMRLDFEELLDRIDGVGITHWALWESGKRQAARMIRENPSLSFIRDETALFPSMISDGEAVYPAAEYLAGMKENGLLLAGGGMGKTTALLDVALSRGADYSPERPAIMYLPLYGWQESRRSWILDSLLDGLHFRKDTQTFEEAENALYDLLDHPIPGGMGNAPVLWLLLDGLNEAGGSEKALDEEILRIASLKGVRILAAGRSEEDALPFRRLHLAELTDEVVKDSLSQTGLLLPENADMQKLLRIPMMLSMYIRSGQMENRQVRVTSRHDLIEAYLTALKDKAVRNLPEDTDAGFQMEAAMDMVLPAIAAEVHRKKHALEDRELFPVVEKCYRLLNSGSIRRLFPQWIGRAKAIRGGAKNADEWYGRIVHSVLWKQMGLILRDEQDRYLISHQIIEEYMLLREKENQRSMRRHNQVHTAWIAVCICLAAAAAWRIYGIYLDSRPYYEKDGLRFEREEGELTVTAYYGKNPDVVIPRKEGRYPVTAVGEEAFFQNSDLRCVTIPDSVTFIGDKAFYSCGSLESVTIPDSVTCIGDKAFYDCESMENVIIPDGVTDIGEDAFHGCDALKSITISGSVDTIGEGAFEYCRTLTDITLENGVKAIEDYAFAYCDSLVSITIPGSVSEFGNYIFWLDSSLTSVTVSDGVESLGLSLFSNCSALKQVNLPKSLKEINGFSGCRSLETLIIPESVDTIGTGAFSDCHSLKKVILPDSLKEIGSFAFSNCWSLENLTIPESVEYIGMDAFSDYDVLVLFVAPGSYAEKFAIEEEIPYTCTASSD